MNGKEFATMEIPWDTPGFFAKEAEGQDPDQSLVGVVWVSSAWTCRIGSFRSDVNDSEAVAMPRFKADTTRPHLAWGMMWHPATLREFAARFLV